MTEQGQEQTQNISAEQVKDRPVVQFPILGSAATKLVFNFRQPSQSAVAAAAKAGEPAPIKRASVTVEISALSDSDIVNMARRVANDPNDTEATAVLKWLATLAREDLQAAVKAEFDAQPAHSNIDLAQVNMESLTLMALATAPRTNRAVPLTDEDWAHFNNVLAAFYHDELPQASGPQFDNMTKLLRTWRALAGLEPEKRKNALSKVLTVLGNFTVWLEIAIKEGTPIPVGDSSVQIDGDIVGQIIGNCAAKAQKLLDVEIPDVDLGL